MALNVNDGPLSVLLGRTTRLLRGRPRLVEEIAGVRYLVSPAAFFQTSAFGAEALVEIVTRFAAPTPRSRVLDLYCGAGLFALALAGRSRAVVGIEEKAAAVRDATAAARLNRRRNTRFFAGRVETRLREAMAGGGGVGVAGAGPFDVVVLDPPRAGCAPEVLAGIARAAPARIVCVSCDPDSLGRDLAALSAAGYALRAVAPVDMFPHTCHVEAVALLERATPVTSAVASAGASRSRVR